MAPAESLVSLVADRRDARRRIMIGAALLGSIAPLAVLGILTSSSMLLIATCYTALAVPLGLRHVARGAIAHAAASYKMRQLVPSTTTLPQARLLSDGSASRRDAHEKL